jgi:hypothetical protein
MRDTGMDVFGGLWLPQVDAAIYLILIGCAFELISMRLSRLASKEPAARLLNDVANLRSVVPYLNYFSFLGTPFAFSAFPS